MQGEGLMHHAATVLRMEDGRHLISAADAEEGLEDDEEWDFSDDEYDDVGYDSDGKRVDAQVCALVGSKDPPPPPAPGVLLMTAYRALIRPSREDAMGRSCILDSHPGRWMPAAERMPAVVRMPACYSRRFKGERPTGAATG